MSVMTRSRAEQHAFNERRWAEIVDDALVACVNFLGKNTS
jgi:hypothetical protein